MSVPKDGLQCAQEMITLLQAAHTSYMASKATRLAAVAFARSAGIPYKDIAEQFNITEAGVRQMLKRAAE